MKIIVANWKMNPTTLREANDLFHFYVDQSLRHLNINIVACPPVLYLEELAKLKKEGGQVALGAQDFFWEETGAFTGQVSLSMLKPFGIEYALLGHSEKRYIAGETDEMINKKLLVALKQNIKPILLIGEKDKGDYRQDILIDQLSRDLAGVEAGQISNLLVCYEPVWAISSNSGGVSDTPENALEAVVSIREILAKMFSQEIAQDIPILYGGSVNSQNVASFLGHPEIAGAVVGSASLQAEEFGKLLEIGASL